MADGGVEVRLSCAQHDLLVPVSHHAILYGEPKTRSMHKYCGKHWSLVISHLILTDTVSWRKQTIRCPFGCLYVKCLLSVILPSRPRFYASSCKPSPKQRSCTFCAISERSNRLMCTQSHLILPSLSVQFASMIWMKFSLLSDA